MHRNFRLHALFCSAWYIRVLAINPLDSDKITYLLTDTDKYKDQTSQDWGGIMVQRTSTFHAEVSRPDPQHLQGSGRKE